MPEVPQERIDPRSGTQEDVRIEQDARHERIVERIRQWWGGDTHAHSTRSTREGYVDAEGIYTVREMREYRNALGMEFGALTEHATVPKNPERISPDHPVAQALMQEAEEIWSINKEHPEGTALFSGVEASIMFDGEQATLDVPDETLKHMDLVIASRHGIEREKELPAIKESLEAAVLHPEVHVLGHFDRNLMAPEHDWTFFRNNFPEAQDFEQQVKRLQAEKKEKIATNPEDAETIEAELQAMYSRIRKAIGKELLSESDQSDARLLRWRKAFDDLSLQYHEMWAGLFERMASKKMALEISMSAQPSKKLIEMAAKAGVPFFLAFDVHDFDRYKWRHTDTQKSAYTAKKRWANQWKDGPLTEEDEELLREYKEERLGSGPGVIPVLRLLRWIKRLESYGVTPERVMNSSKDRLMRFLMEDHGKRTPNLDLLQNRSDKSANEQ